MSEDNRYTIEDLVAKTGFPRRTIRYYVQEGLLEPPAGRGRGGFYYDSQLKTLEFIKSLQEQGIRLSAIAERLRSKEERPVAPASMAASSVPAPKFWTRYEVAPGLELSLRRDMETQLGGRLKDIISAMKTALEEEKHEE